MNKIFETNHIVYRGEPIIDLKDGAEVGSLLALAATHLDIKKTIVELINQRGQWYLRLVNPNGATNGLANDLGKLVDVDVCFGCEDLTKTNKLGEIDGKKACATCLHNERQGVKEYD